MTKNALLPVWDLSDLYPSPESPLISKDLAKASEMAKHSSQYLKGTLPSLDGDKLAKAIVRYEELEQLLGKLSSYAFLYFAENMENEDRARFYQDISEKVNEISSEVIFFTVELNTLSDAELAEKQLASQKLQKYSPWLKDIRAFRPHELSADMEQLLHEKSLSSRDSWVRLFDETFAALRIPYKNKEKTCTEILDLMSDKNATIRKNAALAFGATLKKNAKLCTHITNILAKDKAVEDKWRRFKEPISNRNLSNLVEDQVVEQLLSSVEEHYPQLSHRYYSLKAKWFGRKKLDYWDRNAPFPDEEEDLTPWDEAVTIVLESYANFSPRLAEIGELFFRNKWIHAPPTPGKDSGAFSHPTVPSSHPYLLVNYQGKIRDVMTLAHELGHGIHQWLSRKQGALMADTPLTLAETASVFGEQLTFRNILSQQTDTAKRRITIANKVEDMLNTVVRQVAFCQFERKLHAARQEGELSTNTINDLWLDSQTKSLGSAIDLHGDYAYFWSYIPHFIHSPFYVYSYAFGECLVNALYANYQNSPKDFEKNYLTMLEAGGTKRHNELLSPFGLDASKPDFWNKGLSIISEMIDTLEGL